MAVDLAAYFARVGYEGSRDPTLETLRAVHFAQATSIPFENLDIQLGRPILLDVESLQAKLVEGRRGGYCFEHNNLFAAVLEAIGFRLTRLAARVRSGRAPGSEPLPRTHMLLSVDIAGVAWLADVGFGQEGLLYPLPLNPGPGSGQPGRVYRVFQEDQRSRVLQLKRGDRWDDLYAFTLDPQILADYEMANWWTSTSPRSGFVQNLVVQRLTGEGGHSLRNRDLVESGPDGRAIRATTLDTDDEILDTLRSVFGLQFPSGTRFRCLARVDPA